MVQVIYSKLADHTDYGGGQPTIHVHHVARDVHGTGIAIRVYGEMKIAAKEVVFAKELKLNTIQMLVLTPEAPTVDFAFTAQKYIHHKGEYDNYASIDIFSHGVDGATAELEAGNANAPYDGSIWLNFIALGE